MHIVKKMMQLNSACVKYLLLILAYFLILGCQLSPDLLPEKLSSEKELSYSQSAINNCKAAVFGISDVTIKNFTNSQSNDDGYLKNKNNSVVYEKWNVTPIPDFGMSSRTKLVHLGCGFGDENLDQLFNNSKVSSNSFYSFSSRGDALLLVDSEHKMIFYKWQGN